ncbi:MAG: DUF1385 domain-containing protein [Coriobacteriales bacterium]|jgi:uncharacterized protein YqhQ|nr:DUF1385 domain-containing protein [Coriobacteriales bacterium]
MDIPPESSSEPARHNTQPPAATSHTVFDESDVVCQTHIGGQALIEGIMMRGRYNWAVAVRRPDGDIYVEQHDLVSGQSKNSWMYKPVLRGCTALVESLALGFKAMEIAANAALLEPTSSVSQDAIHLVSAKDIVHEESAHQEPVTQDANQDAHQDATHQEPAMPKPVFGLTLLAGILLGIGIFVVLPAVLTNLLVGDYGQRTLLWNLVDGLIRVAIFIAYIWLIGRLGEVRRMFGYHGAEHRTIHCFEHGHDLTVTNAQRFSSLHVRCGTAFMLMTMIIAILVFTVVPINWIIDLLGLTNEALRLAVVIVSRIVLLPVIAGLSYELTVKWAGSHPEQPLVRLVLWPGLQLQRLTTHAPDDDMVECAIAAMQCVVRREIAEGQSDALNPATSEPSAVSAPCTTPETPAVSAPCTTPETLAVPSPRATSSPGVGVSTNVSPVGSTILARLPEPSAAPDLPL